MLDIGLHNKPIITSKVDAALQELDILFNTTPTEMINNTGYGINFLQFLWSLTPNENKLQEYIYDRINTYTCYASSCHLDVEVTTEDTESSYMYIVKIDIYDPDSEKTANKTYTIKN